MDHHPSIEVANTRRMNEAARKCVVQLSQPNSNQLGNPKDGYWRVRNHMERNRARIANQIAASARKHSGNP